MKTFFYLLFCSFVFLAFSQDIETLQKKHSNWEFDYMYDETPFIHITEKRKMAFTIPKTDFIYEDFGDITMNFAAAKKNGLWGLIDINGKEIGKWEYDRISLIQNYQEDFPEKDWEIQKEGKYGRIRFNGKEILPAEYDKILRFNECYLVLKNEKFGLCDTNGVFLLAIEYDGIFIKDNYILLRKNDKEGVLNTKDMKEILPIIYDDIEYENNSFIVTKNKKQGLINTKGEVLFEPIHKKIKLNNTYIFVSDSSFYRLNLLKKENEPTINMGTCSQDTQTIYIWAMYDSLKNKIFEPKYEDIILWGNKDTFKVILNAKMGFVNHKNQQILPIIYDEILDLLKA